MLLDDALLPVDAVEVLFYLPLVEGQLQRNGRLALCYLLGPLDHVRFFGSQALQLLPQRQDLLALLALPRQLQPALFYLALEGLDSMLFFLQVPPHLAVLLVQRFVLPLVSHYLCLEGVDVGLKFGPLEAIVLPNENSELALAWKLPQSWAFADLDEVLLRLLIGVSRVSSHLFEGVLARHCVLLVLKTADGIFQGRHFLLQLVEDALLFVVLGPEVIDSILL